MPRSPVLRRRDFLGGAAYGAGVLAAGPLTGSDAAGSPAGTSRTADPVPPLWREAERAGLVFGSSVATWELDRTYARLFGRQAGLLLTEDDLLWYRLKPRPSAPLDFAFGDRVVGFAERHHQLTIGAHLVWDQGFGDGWRASYLWSLGAGEAAAVLFGVVRDEVIHYRGRMNAWIVANEVTGAEDGDRNGFRTSVPWYQTIGPGYVAEAFHVVAAQDPGAVRIINDFGFESVDRRGGRPEPRRRAFLDAIDHLLHGGAPVQAVGIQGHLLAKEFGTSFDENGYRAFLREIADRGLHILITELDVLDDGLPADVAQRDQGVADVYARYLDVVLDEQAVKVVSAFGLTDRYTWLEEDQPRHDGARRRPLAFDRHLEPKPAYQAITAACQNAPARRPLWAALERHERKAAP